MSTAAYLYAQAMAVTERARGRAEEERAWLDLLALLDAPAPAPSVVPEAAVEAAASAVRKDRAFSAAAAFGVPMDDVPQCAEMIARAALTAALPCLTTTPSATREATEDEVTEVVTEALTDAYRAERGMSRHTGLTAHDESVIRDQAAHVVNLADARFTITPKEDR